MKGTGRKSEHMTSLSGDIMVPKTHGRIVFRGLIDSLEAEVIEAQVLASGLGEAECCSSLGEVLEYLRSLMAAEVKGTPLPPPSLSGMDAEEIHRRSHAAEGGSGFHALAPSYTQGPVAARLNTLRTRIREAELCAVKVFGPGRHSRRAGACRKGARGDIILALNRLSSALWWLFRRHVLGRPEGHDI